MRRIYAVVPTTIALLIVALFASSAGAAVSFTHGTLAAGDAAEARAHATVDRAQDSASTPEGTTRKVFLHAQAPSIGRTHASQSSGHDGARRVIALGAVHPSLELAAHRAPCAAVVARERGVASPGQPAPSSRAPPIG
jgi:hypothetical protein